MVGGLLRDQQDSLAGVHRLVERDDGFFATDKQRNDHVRIDDDVAQRQYRHAGRIVCTSCFVNRRNQIFFRHQV